MTVGSLLQRSSDRHPFTVDDWFYVAGTCIHNTIPTAPNSYSLAALQKLQAVVWRTLCQAYSTSLATALQTFGQVPAPKLSVQTFALGQVLLFAHLTLPLCRASAMPAAIAAWCLGTTLLSSGVSAIVSALTSCHFEHPMRAIGEKLLFEISCWD